MSKPAVDGLERDLAGSVSVLRLDILDNANRPFLELHGVRVVPAFLLFDGRGDMRARMMVRVPSAAEVQRALE